MGPHLNREACCCTGTTGEAEAGVEDTHELCMMLSLMDGLLLLLLLCASWLPQEKATRPERLIGTKQTVRYGCRMALLAVLSVGFDAVDLRAAPFVFVHRQGRWTLATAY